MIPKADGTIRGNSIIQSESAMYTRSGEASPSSFSKISAINLMSVPALSPYRNPPNLPLRPSPLGGLQSIALDGRDLPDVGRLGVGEVRDSSDLAVGAGHEGRT